MRSVRLFAGPQNTRGRLPGLPPDSGRTRAFPAHGFLKTIFRLRSSSEAGTLELSNR